MRPLLIYFTRIYEEESGKGSGRLVGTGEKLKVGSDIWPEIWPEIWPGTSSAGWSDDWAKRARNGLIIPNALPITGCLTILPINLLCQSKDNPPELNKSLWVPLAPA